jgi:hypothetical protein
MNPAPIMWPS